MKPSENLIQFRPELYKESVIILPLSLGKQKISGAPRKTARLLRRFARRLGGAVLFNTTLESGQSAVEAMLVAPFGILLVHTCGEKGEYYGQMDDKTWSLLQNERKLVFDNPYLQQEEQIAALRGILAKNKVFKVPVEHVVYLPDTSKRTKLFINQTGEILQGGALTKLLAKEKYQFGQVDVQQVLAVLAPKNQ